MYFAPDGLNYMPFQETGIEWLLEHERALLADEMGTGKTIQCCGLINETDPKTVLVVCPASAKDHWKRELEKWVMLCPSVGVLYGKYRTKGRFIIVNYDILKFHNKALRSRYWDLVIIDEGHYLKDIGSARTRQVYGSSQMLPIRGKRVVVLTGTPVINRPIELYATLRYLDGKSWPSYDEFGERYCGGRGGVIIHDFGSTEMWERWNVYADHMGLRRGPVIEDGRDWDRFSQKYNTRAVKLTRVADYQGHCNLGELSDRLKSIMLRRTKREVFPDLPPKRRRVQVLRGKTWNEATEESFAGQVYGLERGEMSDEHVSIVRRENAEEQIARKIQFLENAIDLDDKVVCFVHHKESVKALQHHFGNRQVTVCGSTPNKQRQWLVDRFNQVAHKNLFIGTKAAAEIYTLTAARRVVIGELFWTPGVVTQMEDRVHRYPQTEEVLVDHLAEDGTLDVAMACTCVNKQYVVDELFNGDN